MKYLRYMYLLCVVLTGYEASGQIEKGTRFWGGTIEGSGSFSSSKSEGTTLKVQSNNIVLKVQWGMFAKPDFMFGIGAQADLLPASSQSESNDGFAKNISSQYRYSLVPFVRWYKPLTERISLFVEPALAVGLVHFPHRYIGIAGESGSNNNGFNTSLTVVPGISYRLGERFALETDLNILRLGVDYSSGDSFREFRFASSVSNGITSYFGLRAAFYLN